LNFKHVQNENYITENLGQGEPLTYTYMVCLVLQIIGKHWLNDLQKKFRVILVDQRNHGHSPKSDAFSYRAYANHDLDEVINDLNLTQCQHNGPLYGWENQPCTMPYINPENIKKMMVADIGPKQYPSHHDIILEGLNAIDLTVVKSRKEAERYS
jgi:esterase